MTDAHLDGPAKQRAAILWLTLMCVFWGATFLLMELGCDRLRVILGAEQRLAAAAYFLVLRFALAVVLMPVAIPASVRRLDSAAWRHGLPLSLVFSAGYVLQLFGLTQDDIGPSQSAFLTSLYVVVTPLIVGVVQRRWPPKGVLLGLPLAVFGAAFIAGPPHGGLSAGAWATLGCAVAFSCHIAITDYSARRVDPMALTLTTLVYSLGWLCLALLVAPGGLATLAPHYLFAALRDPVVLSTVGVCALFATVIALAVLNRWQTALHPSRAAILYTTEPVFATLVSIAVGREVATSWLVVSAATILAANLAASWRARAA